MPSETTNKSANLESMRQLPPEEVLFGHSKAMAEVRSRAEKICKTDVSVLVCGEGGTGKEMLARWIHARSSYAKGEFVKVNCAAVPGTLLESELFGYEKGAFTGAHASKPGRVELAHHGTLFLDEISDLEMGLQSKLLHFLQDGTFSRIGDEASRSVNTRVICTTNRELEKEIETGRFRADLFYRINVFQLKLPRLRERREDIPMLAEYFRGQYEKQFCKESAAFETHLINYLKNLDWPGNLRELSNGIARYVLIGPEAVVVQETTKRRTTSAQYSSNGANGVPLKRIAKDAIRDMERNLILEALRANQWNRRKAAVALKISYRALIYKIRDAGLLSRRQGMLAESASAKGLRPNSPTPPGD
jgi:two-component system, NtrC family, response regulator AtoC